MIATSAIPIRTQSSCVMAAPPRRSALLTSKGVNVQSATAPAPHLRAPGATDGKLAGWLGARSATIIALNYLGNYAVTTSKADRADTLYNYSTAVFAAVVYG